MPWIVSILHLQLTNSPMSNSSDQIDCNEFIIHCSGVKDHAHTVTNFSVQINKVRIASIEHLNSFERNVFSAVCNNNVTTAY